MSRGKDICKELKAVRKQIAEENGIPLEIKECTYHGPCRGTCPRCEAEVRYLENALARRIKYGKVATVAGLALGLASCGGQPQGEPTPPSGHPSQEGMADAVDGERPEVPEGPERNITVPDVGELVVTGDIAEMPLLPDDTIYEEGGIEDDNALVGVIVEDEPEFPGGMEAMYKFIADNLRYPRLALENNIQGKVYVTFVVESDGTLSNPKILRDIGGGCGQEAIRLVKSMPKWKPGKQQGKTTRVQFNLPINFTITEDMKVRIIEGLAPVEQLQGMPIERADSPVEAGNPYAPTQKMEVDGVKVIVK